MAKRLMWSFVGLSAVGSTLLALSGRWSDPWMWTYIGVWGALGTYAMLVIDEDLARERFTPPSSGADRLSLRVIRIVAIAHLIVGALDAGRWQIGAVPSSLRAASFAGMATCFMLMLHAMRANRFFSPVVRIQQERGHRLVDTGPYARVRHPGYAGMIPAMSFSALALGSWVALGISVVYVALIVRRVRFEDAFLRANLSGYTEYAGRVRYRLVPGLW
jgi:protein-S-isoprenylcysteine O-methyltransferase Ste14